MDRQRAYERCMRRAAELLVADDRVLCRPDVFAALLPFVDGAVRATIAAAEDGDRPFTLCIIQAMQAARDGSLACAHGDAGLIETARRAAIPVYALLPGGPQAEVATVAGAAAQIELTPDAADPVSAFITDRGIYRPAMLHRHLEDGDAPLDVIPLTG